MTKKTRGRPRQEDPSSAWGCKLFAAPALDLPVTGTLNRADAPDDWQASIATALAPSPQSRH